MANYRNLQVDFSGGELDPMIEANVTHPLRHVGVKSSINTYHLPSGAILKRPPAKLRSNRNPFTVQGSVAVIIDDYSLKVFFTDQGLFVYADNDATADIVGTLAETNADHTKSHFAVHKNLIVETNKNMTLKSYKITGSFPNYTIEKTEPALTNWKPAWGNPSSCMFASGRLFLATGNTLLASRTPESGEDRFFDFTLSDTDSQGQTVVYPTHAIEVQESSLDSTEISWMANLGRIIVGTPQAIFMSSDEIITPETFHLVPTSYISCSKLQPRMLQSYIIFTSKDEQKIYLGLYNDQIKGLQIAEVTSNARHLFLDGIKNIEITDYPSITIFILTKSNDLRVGTAVPDEGGIRFAFSTWTFAERPAWIFINRQDSTRPYDSFGFFAYGIYHLPAAQGGDVNKLSQLRVEYKEPAHFGSVMAPDDINEIYLDRLNKFDVSSATEIDLSEELAYLKPGDPLYIIVRGADDIIEQKPIDLPNDYIIHFPAGSKNLYLGEAYKMELQLLQQLLPNNTGIALSSNHSVERIDIQIFKSVGGEVWYNGRKVKDLEQLIWGKDKYGKSLYMRHFNEDGTLDGYVGKYFSGVYSVENPTQQTIKDELMIISDEIYPFNLLAVAIKYNITEVN